MSLTTENCLPALRRMLAGAGFDEANPDLAVLWSVLKEWVALPVDGMDPDVDADMLLFEGALVLREGGAYSFGPSFVVGFARQFKGTGGPRAEEWTRRVETSRSYQVAVEHRPLRVELYHSPV